MSSILVIDDEEGIRDILTSVLTDEGYTSYAAEDGFSGLQILETTPVDLVILDVWLPNMGGIDVLKRIREEYPEVEVIIISGHASIDLAVQATKLGAFNFLEKPLSLENTVTVVRNALELQSLRRENRELRSSLLAGDDMVGHSRAMEQIRTIIRQSAASDSRILITGENGTGKELVAREIHRHSARADRPFVEVNCAAIPETLIESELFGHEKGAFTNALSRRRGKFELADGGTLFLDEIGDMSLGTQAKVLRVIQEMRFERVGGEQSISVDVRIIAATNRDLQRHIREGRFREDLFFRLNVIPIHVPALRERTEDIPALVEYFSSRLKLPSQPTAKRITPAALRILEHYQWPGNVRELKNFVERVNIMCSNDEISPEEVRRYLLVSHSDRSGPAFKEYLQMRLNEARERFEKDFITCKLQENEYNVSRTAGVLGIRTNTLYNKINRYAIPLERIK